MLATSRAAGRHRALPACTISIFGILLHSPCVGGMGPEHCVLWACVQCVVGMCPVCCGHVSRALCVGGMGPEHFWKI